MSSFSSTSRSLRSISTRLYIRGVGPNTATATSSAGHLLHHQYHAAASARRWIPTSVSRFSTAAAQVQEDEQAAKVVEDPQKKTKSKRRRTLQTKDPVVVVRVCVCVCIIMCCGNCYGPTICTAKHSFISGC